MAIHIQRRKFLGTVGSAIAWPLGARAQQAVMPVIGFLGLASPIAATPQIAGWRQGLSETGYVEGRNVVVEYRWVEGQFGRLPGLASDLIARQPTAILAHGPPAVMALKAQTATIPIVFTIGEDPVKEGLVASLNRPGGNVTGFSHFANLLFGKKLGLLLETAPEAMVLGLLVNPENPNAAPDTKDVEAAADAIRRQLRVFAASTDREFEPAFAAMVQSRVGALLVNIDPVFIAQRELIATLAARHTIPAIYDRREFPLAGGLMSYGASEVEGFHQCGIYVGRILKGEKPADLPVLQATKFEFVINLRIAKALGLTIPPGVLAIADEVIE
jgi:putative ABC transport system substrate-binding protein